MKTFLLGVLILSTTLIFRLWHIEFGLPHSFYADEPEIAELAIKYTYEFRNIIHNRDYYKLIPISFVYGTFPAYLFTLAVMIFSKTLNIAGISFDKTTLYIFMRGLNSLLSVALVPITALIYSKLFRDKTGVFIALLLTALNWKLIVHAHYVNPDIILTLILSTSFLFGLLYLNKPDKSLYVWLLGISIGAAIGTKITALISLPMFIYLFLSKRDYKSLVGFLVILCIVFIVTNPFSFIFFNTFIYRIFEMIFKEGGLVFDSVDYSPVKYITAIGTILTPPMFVFSIYGLFISVYKKTFKPAHIFILGNILVYVVFFSIQSRRVDRWMLPIIPLLLVYASYGITRFVYYKGFINKAFVGSILAACLAFYIYPSIVLLYQFRKNTPKSEAYLWAQENLPATSNKLVITEEGLDPMNKLKTEAGYVKDVRQLNVYVSENAQLDFPPKALGYDYIILSSRPIQNYRKHVVSEKYPSYAKAWVDFENLITMSDKFELIKKFETTKSNLIPLSNIYIYKKTD